MEDLRYPIGPYTPTAHPSPQQREEWLNVIAQFPAKLRHLLNGLSESDTLRTYRPEGWTIRQVVHHCADSHMNSLMRFKLALTEDHPTIRPYYEDRWALLDDGNEADLRPTLNLIEGLHHKWHLLLSNLSDTDWKETFVHPEHNRSFSLEETLGMYAWHCKHHLAHIQLAIAKEL